MQNNQRNKHNVLGVLVTLISNIVLCISKLIVGTLFANISVTADAVNNLSDASNNVVSLISLKIAEKPADKEHPFGHERMEYIASTIVGFVVVVLGIQIASQSISKIIQNIKQPYLPQFDILMIVVLSVAIIVKLFMYLFLKKSSKKHDLILHKAMALDSISDVVATTAILAAAVIGYYCKINLDGYMGLVVSVIIFIGGIKIVRETFNTLMGVAPTVQQTNYIKDKVLSYTGVLGIHDLIIHDYGPQKRFVTAHIEIDSKMTIIDAHELADTIERDFLSNDNTELLIHLDPIVTDDQYTNELHSRILQYLMQKFGDADTHDFRVVYGSKNRVLFDLVLPYGTTTTKEELDTLLKQEVESNVDFLITIDYK